MSRSSTTRPSTHAALHQATADRSSVAQQSAGQHAAVPAHPTDQPDPPPPPPTPSAPRRASSRRAGKAPAEQSSAASRRAIRSGGRGSAGLRMSARGTRGLVRPDKTAIPTSRSRAMSGRTWSLREEKRLARARANRYSHQRTGLPRRSLRFHRQYDKLIQPPTKHTRVRGPPGKVDQ